MCFLPRYLWPPASCSTVGQYMVAMGCMAVVFVAAVTFAAHHFNRAFVSGLRLNLDLCERTEELTHRTEALTQRTQELIEVNTRLEAEIAQREAAEKSAAPGAENGGARPANWRHRARL